jgi:hypothetical protein
MTTPARDRLAALFEGMSLPKSAPDGVKTFAQMELEAPKTPRAIATSTSQAPSTVTPATPLPKHVDDHNADDSSDEEDEYVAAFNTKPKMKVHAPPAGETGKRIQQSQATQSRRKHPENFDLNDGLHQNLPKADKHGREAVGHFCPFNMVTKFPYKYMDDSNSRVSQHFFANGKIYEREWDM